MSEPTQPTPPGAPEPPVPPVPPTVPEPPVPPVPPVPQYGEYAPGYVPPAPAPQNAQNAQYAQYAQQPYGAASFPQQSGGPRRRKTWDVVLSVILLVVGFFGAMIGVIYGILFTDPTVLDQALQQQGYSGLSGGAGAAPAVLIISHVGLYLLAAGITVPMLVKRRIAFWVPLTAGVIAAIFFWGALFAVLLSDPGFVSQLR